MKFIKKAFAPKEVKAALGALDEAAYRFQTGIFQEIREMLEKALLSNPDAFVRVIRESEGGTPREWVYSQIGNIAGDMLESGKYHIYRGVLNHLGPGKDLLRMFDETYDELLLMKAIDPDYAEQQKRMLRNNIKDVG